MTSSEIINLKSYTSRNTDTSPATNEREQREPYLAEEHAPALSSSLITHHSPLITRKNSSLLIIKLGSIGDIVHTLPAVAQVRRAVPHARISWAVERRAAEILRESKLIDDLIELDTGELRRFKVSEKDWNLSSQTKRLRANEYDAAIDFQGLWKSAGVAFLSGAKRRYGFSRLALREPSSRFLMTDTFDVPVNLHVIRKNIKLVEQALQTKVSYDAEDFEFPINLSEQHDAESARILQQAFGKNDQPFAILNPGGNWWTKRWSPESFGELADRLFTAHNLRSIVIYGAGEADLAARIVAASRTRAATMHKLTLKGFCALARRAKVYVGGDTGPTHLAVAMRTPVVGLYGPTEWWRNGSPYQEDVCVERADLACRSNCHRRSCDNWLCMNTEVAPVLQAVNRRLNLSISLER